MTCIPYKSYLPSHRLFVLHIQRDIWVRLHLRPHGLSLHVFVYSLMHTDVKYKASIRYLFIVDLYVSLLALDITVHCCLHNRLPWLMFPACISPGDEQTFARIYRNISIVASAGLLVCIVTYTHAHAHTSSLRPPPDLPILNTISHLHYEKKRYSDIRYTMYFINTSGALAIWISIQMSWHDSKDERNSILLIKREKFFCYANQM